MQELLLSFYNRFISNLSNPLLFRSLSESIPPLDSREGLSFKSFGTYLLPLLVCFNLSAVLVFIPNTLPIRLALLPIATWSTYKSSTRINVAASYPDGRFDYWNFTFVMGITDVLLRIIVWTFTTTPPTRRGENMKKGEVDSSKLDKYEYFKRVTGDARELMSDRRGCDWNFGNGLPGPPLVYPGPSKASFVRQTAVSVVIHLILLDFSHYTVRSFSPSTFGSPTGGSIFDPSLPLMLRYIKSSFITLLFGLILYSSLQAGYGIGALYSVLLADHHPSRWPPFFYSPWRSTSLSEFWSKRWHQTFRENVFICGYKPLAVIGGRLGGVMGAFAISAFLHYVGLWGIGRGSEAYTSAGFFIIMGVGIILEHEWKRFTGDRVKGAWGWLWTMLWVIGWGNLVGDVAARMGMLGGVYLPSFLRLSERIFGIL